MTVFLPDTNILIDALNGKRGRREMLRDLVLQGHRLACCKCSTCNYYIPGPDFEEWAQS